MEHLGVYIQEGMLVYLVENRVNGKRYVGKTTRTLEQRWHEHVYAASCGRDEMALYSAIRKHGSKSFQCNVLQRCDTEDGLNVAEKECIQRLGTHVSLGRGYNMTLGGDGISGYRHTEEAKQRMSEARKGVPLLANRGRKHAGFQLKGWLS